LGEQAIRGDVAHAYELSGPRSIGKNTVALRLAQTLNCTAEPRIAGGCGACVSCMKIEKGIHPDVLMVTRLVDQIEQRGKREGERKADAKLISIEQIRATRSRPRSRSVSAPARRASRRSRRDGPASP